jgi:hypothetical protein
VAVIFPRWTNYLPIGLAAAGPLVLGSVVFAFWYWGSPEFLEVGYQPEQPVPFSHRLHAGELGLDCRYCHNTVEVTGHAAIPPTATCMNCHTKVRTDSARLAKVRLSAATGEPIEWVKVHMLPQYAYFDHSVHIAAGVGCASCHGRIDQMERVYQAEPLSMGWCLDCHRDPGKSIRPPGVSVTQMDWEPTDSHSRTQSRSGREVNPPEHCSGCHR